MRSYDPGPRPWEEAWHDALYGPAGFYRRHAPADHFATSAQGVPGGGEVLAEAVVALARRHRCTRVVDVGAGSGELLVGIREFAPDLHLTGVDVVDRRPDTVDAWLPSAGGAALPGELDRLTDVLVVAHEWLDVVPCPVVERDGSGAWREVAVGPDGTESLTRALPSAGPASSSAPAEADALAWLERWVPDHVTRAEVGLARDRAAADLLARVDRGVLLVVDYTHERATRPGRGTLTGFRHGREVAPVPDGSCDLTAHVAVDSLVDHLARAWPTARCHVSTQADALADLLPGAAGPVPHELARREPTAYLQALARRAALATLRAPGGLGGFRWVVVERQ